MQHSKSRDTRFTGEFMRCPTVILVILLAFVSINLAEDLPTPPEGFSWREITEIHGFFLIPDGWYFRAEEAGGHLAFFITEEEIKPPENYLTGISINVYLDDPSAPGKLERHINEKAELYSVELITGGFGPFLTIECEYDLAETEEHGAIRIVLLAIVNSKTDASYLVMFESPVDKWTENWPKGKSVITKLGLDGDT